MSDLAKELHGLNRRRYDAGELRTRLADRAAEVAAELLPGGHRRGANYFASDIHGGPGNSLALNLRGRFAGTWKDFATDQTGDVLDLVQASYGMSFAEAVDQAAALVGLDPLRVGQAATPAPRDVAHDAQRLCRRLDGVAERLALVRARRALALGLWRRGLRIVPDTPPWTYLTETRRLGAQSLPATLRWLPETPKHPPAIVAALGVPIEPEPGRLVMPDRCVRGCQVLRLSADGREKIEAATIGHCARSPLVVAPLNDLLGLHVVEGLEDALSLAEAFGVGAWATCSASRMPSVVRAVPWYTDWVTLWHDGDEPGRRATREAHATLQAHGFDAERIEIKRFHPPPR